MFMPFSNASIRSNSSWTFCCRDFSESFLSWYFLIIKGKTTEEALVWGTVNSASVIGYVGAQKGLLKIEDIDTWVERARSSGVKVEEI